MKRRGEHRERSGQALLLGVLAGVFLVAVGLGALIVASGYRFGTPQRMGSGFFPTVLSVLLIMLGIAVALFPPKDLPEMPWPRVRPILCILGAMLAFALLVRPAGLVPAIIVSVFLAALAEPGRRPVPTLILACAIAALTAGIFVFGLNVPIRLFWR